MSIPDLVGQGKAQLSRIPANVFIVSILVLSASASFGLGFLAGQDQAQAGKSGVWVEDLFAGQQVQAVSEAAVASAPKPALTATPTPTGTGAYVASKSGEKYYLTTCSGVSRIKEENKVYFNTKAEAEAKGYEPAANCPGL
ncbi:MAG: protein of unknown function with transrane region [Parcubacteria group bacterium]|nr:protein of unknown function with transrane region [Parcubacteria group bacterium]